MSLHPAILAADRSPPGLECCAPEHWRDAQSMRRDASGALLIGMSESVRSALWPRPPRTPPREVFIGLGRSRLRA